MAGWGEADQTSHPVLQAAGEDSSVFGSLALAAMERLTPQEMERVCFGKLRDPAAAEEVRLPSRPESAGLARRLVLSVIRSWELQAQVEKAELLTGEVVANAIRHAGGRTIGLRLVRRPGWLRVEVRDSSRALPCLIVSADPAFETGHGLRLVDALADRWGADLLPRGKGVWFELRIRER